MEMLGTWLYTVLLNFFNFHNEKGGKTTITTVPGILIPLATQKLPISQSDLVQTMDPNSKAGSRG